MRKEQRSMVDQTCGSCWLAGAGIIPIEYVTKVTSERDMNNHKTWIEDMWGGEDTYEGTVDSE